MKTQRIVRLAVVAAFVLWASNSLKADTKPIAWEITRTTSPASVEELKALQTQVKTVVEKVTPSTVGLLVGMGAGSGVIVSEDGLILTAAHVIGKPGQTLEVVLADGTFVKGKTLGSNEKYDSGMVKITGKVPEGATWPGAKEGKWPAAPIAKSADLKKGQWVISLGHPGGPKKERRPPVRVGRFEDYLKAETALRTDCTLVGGDSGGPLFDLAGNVVGIHSRIGLYLELNMHVPSDAFKEEWVRLERGDAIGKSTRVELGIVRDGDAEGAVVKSVTEGGPAEKAGFMAGDKITSLNGNKVESWDDVSQMLPAYDPGKVVTIEVLRDDKTVSLKVTLAARNPKKGR